MQTQLFTPDNFARKFTVRTSEGVVYSRGLIKDVLDEASKLIIGFFPLYFKGFNSTPKINDNYDEEVLIKNGTITYELLIVDCNSKTFNFEQAIEIKLSRNIQLTWTIEIIVHRLNDILMSAMLSGNVESTLFVSKLNYNKEPL